MLLQKQKIQRKKENHQLKRLQNQKVQESSKTMKEKEETERVGKERENHLQSPLKNQTNQKNQVQALKESKSLKDSFMKKYLKWLIKESRT